MVRFLLLCCLFSYVSSDCIFDLGEWAFEYCNKEVGEARAKNPNLVRGICEVVQEQLEKFLAWRSAQLAEELNISLQGDICARFKVRPYDGQARRGIESVVELAISENSRDRTLLGDKLESWAEIWITRVARDSENSPFEYISIKDKSDMAGVHERIAEFQKNKQEKMERGEL